MESVYTVGVSNRFASLMAEEDDPGDQVITQTPVTEKIDKTAKRKDAKSGTGVGVGGKQGKDNREKAGQQTRKPAQDSGKRKNRAAPRCTSFTNSAVSPPKPLYEQLCEILLLQVRCRLVQNDSLVKGVCLYRAKLLAFSFAHVFHIYRGRQAAAVRRRAWPRRSSGQPEEPGRGEGVFPARGGKGERGTRGKTTPLFSG